MQSRKSESTQSKLAYQPHVCFGCVSAFGQAEPHGASYENVSEARFLLTESLGDRFQRFKMRWLALVLVCATIVNVISEPDPKKYKQDDGEKDKKSESPLTDDEKSFLREVEEKFGVKSEIPVERQKNDSDITITATNSTQKAPFPAVIAIEIVNDTDSKSKEKRTIDANLGYGYRTHNGYTYTYFGKPTQEKGKFMIYPYSQQNAPSTNGHSAEYRQHLSEKHLQRTSVEIQPSQAFELVSVKDGQYEEKTRSPESPQSYTNDAPTTHPSTLYTTYNGQELTGLSGQFPSLQSNYFVEPKQLLANPQYQEVGLNQDYLSTNSLDQNRPVVPVLVLRIPSSYLKNPTAELYANLPNNYPLSHYLNNVNLQGLVNQYFKKNGYDFAPQVRAYQSHIASSAITPTVSSAYSTEPQQYSNPHVQPSYTQADYSGVQYSAVKPVMAKYPSGFTKHLNSQAHYRRPTQQPKYEYRYQHAPQPNAHTQAFYGQSEYQNQQQPTVASYELQNEHTIVKPTVETGSSEIGSPQYTAGHDTKVISVQYDSNVPSHSSLVPENQSGEKSQYDYSKETQAEYSPQQTLSQDYNSKSLSHYESSQIANAYYLQKQPGHAEALSSYPSQASSEEQGQQSYPELTATQGYEYVKPGEEQISNSFLLSENYPSKDQIATVLPYRYKPLKRPNTATVQTVSYVTPEPHPSKYQSRYKIMVPQTILKSQDSEKVTYVNSMPMHYTKAGYYSQDHSSEEQYNIGTHYIPQINKQKQPSYPKNYLSYLKRMTRPGIKSEGSLSKKQSEKITS
ncbi:unnamed protein product, partial [Iphiclides podalirius]